MDIRKSIPSFKMLSFAVKRNIIYLVEELLESYCFQSYNWEDYILLLIALQRGYVRMIHLLLNKGCRVRRNMRTNRFYTPLYYAVMLKDISILRRLLVKGASITDKDLNEETPLCLAIRTQEFEMVDLMLSMYDFDNINILNNYYFTHFYVACMRNKFNVVKSFIEYGMPVNGFQDFSYLDQSRNTPLHFAVKYVNPEIVEFLLRNGADICEENLYEQTALHLAYHMRKEVEWKSEKRKKLNEIINLILLVNTIVHANPTDVMGISHFHIACAEGILRAVESFLKFRVDINAATLPNTHYPSYTGGHFAIMNGHVEVVKLLLRNNANFYMVTSIGDTFLHFAVEYQNLKIVQELIKYANIIISNHKGNTPLHTAFYKNNDVIVDLLLRYCPKNVNPRNDKGLTHFHIACSRNNTNIVKKFLEYEISINQCVNVDNHYYSGYTPLHFAVAYNRLPVVDVLLQYNVNVNAKEAKGLTALHLACKQNHLKFSKLIFKFLKNYHQKGYTIDWTSDRIDHMRIIKLLLLCQDNLNATDNTNRTPLFHACTLKMPYYQIPAKYLNVHIEDILKNILMKEMLLRRQQIINILIDHGADLYIRNDNKETILHYLLHQPLNDATIELLLLFINRGVEIDAVDMNNETPLILAAKHADTVEANIFSCLGQTSKHKIVKILLEKGANPNAKGINGMTPLHYCSSLYCIGMEQIFKLIINAHGDINAQDSQGRTPLHAAIYHNKYLAVVICLRNGADINILDCHGQDALFYIGTQRNDFNLFYNIVFKLIHNHIYKLKQLGFYIRDSLYEQLQIVALYDQNNEIENRNNDNDIKLFLKQCQLEIERLKKVNISPSTSLYNLLLKPHHEISKYSNNETFKTIAQSRDLNRKFFHYGYLIRLQFKKGLVRNNLLKFGKISIQFFSTYRGMPEECLDEILKHLENHNLLKLQNVDSIFVDIYC